MVCYGSPRDGDSSGQGFIGTTRERLIEPTTSGQETQAGRVIWKGFAPATDPLCNDNWSFLSGMNSNQPSTKPSEEHEFAPEAFNKHRERQRMPLRAGR